MVGLFSKYQINCLTPIFVGVGTGLLGVGIERASLCLLGAGISRASSLTRTKLSSSLSVSPDNNLLISSLRRLIILLLYKIFFYICAYIPNTRVNRYLVKYRQTGSNRIPKVKVKVKVKSKKAPYPHVLYYSS